MAMDEPVRLMYRKLLQTGFEYAGSIENPSIFLDSLEEGIRICDAASTSYMNIYINIDDNIVEDIRYLCSCDPTANVVIEILCHLVKEKTISQVKALNEKEFYDFIGSQGEMLQKRVKRTLELLNRGINEYPTDQPVCGIS
jgi:NifU-like protein involved in Fe-S cluster formation